jgi:hypothetical protein
MPVKNHADAFKNQAWNVQISSKSTTLQKKNVCAYAECTWKWHKIEYL